MLIANKIDIPVSILKLVFESMGVYWLSGLGTMS